MQLWINGEIRETPALGTVAELAQWLQLPAFGSAVELNGRVIRRAEHRRATLHEADRLEVIRLVGGG